LKEDGIRATRSTKLDYRRRRRHRHSPDHLLLLRRRRPDGGYDRAADAGSNHDRTTAGTGPVCVGIDCAGSGTDLAAAEFDRASAKRSVGLGLDLAGHTGFARTVSRSPDRAPDRQVRPGRGPFCA
jgi:hypothetical protein